MAASSLSTDLAAGSVAASRSERRKAKTRAELVAAAQRLFGESGDDEWSIQEITDAADVGFGSFYNHFVSKAELFDTAIAEMLEAHAAWIDEVLAGESEPSVVFATSVRLTARLPYLHPRMAQVLKHSTGRMLSMDRGLAPRALRDIRAAIDAGQFQVDDLEVALAVVAGAVVAVLDLAAERSPSEVDVMSDELTRTVLRGLRLPEDDVQAVVARPLPAHSLAR